MGFSNSVIVIFGVLIFGVNAKGFLHDDQSTFTMHMLDRDLQTAMEEVMGCGSRKVSQEGLARIKNAIENMWNTMPKNSYGNLEWRSLRYVAHRYFMHKSSMLIRGMEPQLALMDSGTGAAEILSNQVPDHVNEMLGGEQAKRGYDIDDGVSLLAALEQLVFDSESVLLEDVYDTVRVDKNSLLTAKHMKRLLEGYMVHWMLGEDKDSINILMQNRTLLETGFPHWSDIKGFIEGRIRFMDFQRAQSARAGFARTLMDKRYSFDDAHTVIGGITQTFQGYWESECITMKLQLAGMDKTGTGRVKLSDFYGTGMDADWRFGESESYLRQLGVLDESSPWIGKQVIIPNYLLAASNCIVSTPHYLICCQNECESLLRDIEQSIGTPMADPQRVLEIVGNLTSSSVEEQRLPDALVDQLQIVAKAHNGMVPLHGRLFAQWMHYAYPHECPFPHKAGSFLNAHTLTPEKFGDSYIASQDDMVAVVTAAVSVDNESVSGPEQQGLQWMAQWTLEEELFADYTHMTAPWEVRRGSFFIIGLLSVVGSVVVLLFGGLSSLKNCGTCLITEKAHMV